MTNEDKDKKEYELGLLLKKEEDLAGVLSVVTQHNGELIGEPRAKRLALAYEIKKTKEAVFVSVGFRAYGDDAKALEGDLNVRAEVLRFLLIIPPPVSDRSSSTTPYAPRERHARPMRSSAPASSASSEPSVPRPAPSRPLSNEALEKKIEEILQ